MSTPAPTATTLPASSQATTSPAFPCDIERGPNWLIVRLHSSEKGAAQAFSDDDAWADHLWSVCEKHFTYRLVVEMDEVRSLSPQLSEQLALLGQRLSERGGALKLCGLSAKCKKRFDAAHAELHNHATRRDALLSSDAHHAVFTGR